MRCSATTDQGLRMQLQTGIKTGWSRLYDMGGGVDAVVGHDRQRQLDEGTPRTVTCCVASCAFAAWLAVRLDNRAEAAEIFRKAAPVFTQEIALLEVEGTMSIIRTERTKGKAHRPGPTSATGATAGDLLDKFAKLNPQPTSTPTSPTSFLSEAPHLPRSDGRRHVIRPRRSRQGLQVQGRPGRACGDIDLSIRRSEFVAIVGPCWLRQPTTILRDAGCSPKPRAIITIDGKRVDGRITDVGIVFQDAILLDWRNVLD